MNRKISLIVLAAISLLLVTAPGSTAQEAEAAAAQPEVAALVRDFAGEVGIKKPDGDWTPAEKSMRLTEGDFISTGFESWVMLDLPGGAEARLGELTQIKMGKLLSREGAVKTLLRMRTGELDAHIKKAPGVETKFEVNTPTSTLAVRGTKPKITFGDGFGTEVTLVEGVAMVTSNSGESVAVSRGDSTAVTSGESSPQQPSDNKEEKSSESPSSNIDLSPDEQQANQDSGPLTSFSTPGESTQNEQVSAAIQNATLTVRFEITDQ